MTRGPFTGRHMAAVMIGFFGTVIAVNMLMATLAVRTFGGTVVDNSYVASQKFNGWLKEAREQDALRWQATESIDPAGRLVVNASGPSGPLLGATVEARASHPLGRVPEQVLAMKPVGGGLYRSSAAMPPGRWIVSLSVERDGKQARYLKDVRR